MVVRHAKTVHMYQQSDRTGFVKMPKTYLVNCVKKFVM